MTDTPFGDAEWIARPVPPSTRITRHIRSTRAEWAHPGHTLAQTFTSTGPVTAVSISLVEPRGVEDAFTSGVHFTVTLRTAEGDEVTSRTWSGPQLVWDYFGIVLDVDPPAAPGEYVVELAAETGIIGWSSDDAGDVPDDDGVSPLPVVGPALADGVAVEGVRMVGVDTLPAPNPVFRRLFDLTETPDSAELAAAVLGTGVVYLNGVRVGDEALEPAVTDYDKTVLFRTWDVGHLLSEGRNELQVYAGRERYSARGGDVWGWNLAPWHREPVALVHLALSDADGRTVTVDSDGEWETAAGTVEAERLFRGEDWVLRAEEPEWEPVAVVAPPRGALRRAMFEPVRALAPLAPRTSRSLPGGRTVHDFGDVMVGRLRCRVSGAAGSRIRVVSGEQLAADGSVICENFLVAGEAQLDTLRLETPVTDHVWEPQFGYRGFRWTQIQVDGDARVDSVRAVPLYTELTEVGSLTTDEPVIDWINDATARTFRNNLHGIPTDTPIYEKNGWTADAHLATEGLLHHFDLRATFGKWVDDHRDAQAEDGSMPQIIPTPGWGRATDPTWSSSAVFIPWYLYREYGDRQFLAGSAAMMQRFADSIVDRLEDGLWTQRTWGDWLSPGHHVGPEGMKPIGSAMAAATLKQVAAALRELGDDRADDYAAHAAQVARAYHESYFDADAGVYAVPGVQYRQALNILPLAFDLLPAKDVESVRRGLIADLEHRTAGHLDCGAVGIRHLLPVLSAAGRDDLALTVLTQRTRPSWGAWYESGESTLLESWDIDARSRNHYFLGSVAAWIQQKVGGLRLLEPGWRSFEIAPIDDERISRARMRHRTPHGEAALNWHRGAGGWRIEVDVPPGTTAQLRVAGRDEQLQAGHHELHLR